MSAPPTLKAASDALRSRQLSAVELTQEMLARIARHDGPIHAYVTLTAERALADAARADVEIAAGRWRGPLHGIPMALKDVVDVAGVKTMAQSRLLADNVATESSGAWARLEAAGAVLLGKLTTHEFAIGGPSFDLPHPPARNPWNTAHFTGGSSSGSGACIGAGLALGALGTDSGGSIRVPAAYCGAVGLKPTYGRVSRRGVVPLSASLDHVGPLAWTVEDCALILAAMEGQDPADPTSVEAPLALGALDTPLLGLRVGYAEGFDAEAGVGDEARAAVAKVLQTLTALGARVESVATPSLNDLADCARTILLGETFATHEADIRARPEAYGEVVRKRIYSAAMITGVDYIRAVRWRRVLSAQMAKVMEGCDVLVSATTAGPAPSIDAVSKIALVNRPPPTFPFNLTGAPALSMCCGFSQTDLPLAVQFAARPFEDGLLLRVAHAYERATTWRAIRPTLA
jgi:aspartyl-tRNA(Asn)/glutamyl-tRNA(Gln) amidotransferase subunit A